MARTDSARRTCLTWRSWISRVSVGTGIFIKGDMVDQFYPEQCDCRYGQAVSGVWPASVLAFGRVGR